MDRKSPGPGTSARYLGLLLRRVSKSSGKLALSPLMPHTAIRLRCPLIRHFCSRIHTGPFPLVSVLPSTTDLAAVLAFDPDIMLLQFIVGFDREIKVDCNPNCRLL